MTCVIMPVGLIAAVLFWCGGASAHAFLEHANPPVGGTVSSAPAQVSIEFTEPLEPRFSTIVVLDANGSRVDKGDVHVAPNDARQLNVSLLPLRPGTY
jgi:methionine-rich copper-binding protein CopC